MASRRELLDALNQQALQSSMTNEHSQFGERMPPPGASSASSSSGVVGVGGGGGGGGGGVVGVGGAQPKLTVVQRLKQKRAVREDMERTMRYKKRKLEGDRVRAEEEKTRRRYQRNYTSEDSGVHDDDLHVYYCVYCGRYAYICDKLLDAMERRRSDRAYYIDTSKCEFKTELRTASAPVGVKRAQEIVEVQYRLHCAQCKLQVGYRPKADSPIVYVLPGAVTNVPSQIGRPDLSTL